MKFFESGKRSQVMPSGVSQRQLPHENFQPGKPIQAKATIPPPNSRALALAIAQRLRAPK